MELIIIHSIIVLLENILSIPMEEIILVCGFKKNLTELRISLLRTRDILSDAVDKRDRDGFLIQSLKQLEDVVFEADELLDELMYQVNRLKIKNQNKVTLFLSSIRSRSEMARRIKDINTKLEEISHVIKCRLPSLASNPFKLTSRGIHTSSLNYNQDIQGREYDLLIILKMLFHKDAPLNKQLSVVPILGMGGIGKTTLARQVFNDIRVTSRFQRRIWVSAFHDINEPILLKTVLKSLNGETIDLGTMSIQVILETLGRELRSCRYLLVIDDLLDTFLPKWDEFVKSLAEISSAHGNCILVTTRSEGVASKVQTLSMHRLSRLSDIECWCIIRAGAFKGSVDIPTGFEEIGRSLAKRCQGLPLAAKVVGNVLRKRSNYEWLLILKAKDGDFLSEILGLNFDDLPSSSLKMCFAYCSIFPKGYSFERKQLIKLWMAEEFLQTNHGYDDMENPGVDFLNYLLQNSLFQDQEQDGYGNISSCKMHDVVHDFCFSMSPYSTLSSDVEKKDFFSIAQAIYRRTLFFTGDILDNMYLRMKRLHALVLRGSNIKELPEWIGRLIHLRFLDISFTNIEQLPESVGELYNLQTLQAVDEGRGHGSLKKLPKTLIHLINLRHLQIPSIELPPKIGKLTSLQTLPYYKVGHEKGCRIEELGSMKNLGGELEIQNLERVDDIREAMSAELNRKPNIQKLRFEWDESRGGSTINDMLVLECLEPHPNLKSLEICGFSGSIFPSWITTMKHNGIEHSKPGLYNLMHIVLRNCSKFYEIPMLGHLPHLKKLYLIGLTDVILIEHLFYGFKGYRNRNLEDSVAAVFPMLETLELSEMPKLRWWDEVERGTDVFPSLKYLKIEGCPQLESAPSHFPCLKELVIIGVDSDLPLKDICGSNLRSLTRLVIQDMLGIAHFPEVLFRNNWNLKYLTIRNCPNLTHLVPSRHFDGFAYLKELYIENCAELRELPENLITKEFFGTLLILDCPELKSAPYTSGQTKGLPPLPTLPNEAEIPPVKPAVELKKNDANENKDQQEDTIKEHTLSSSSSSENEIMPAAESQLGSERLEQASSPMHGEQTPAVSSRNPIYACISSHGSPSEITEELIASHVADDKSTLHGYTNITISVTGELFKFVDLKLQVLNALSSREMQHADKDFLKIDLDPETNDYLLFVKNKLTYNGSDVLIPDDLIYKGGSGALEFPKADEWRQYSIMSLMEKDLVSLPERPDCSNLVLLFLQRNYRLSHIPPSFFDRMVALRFLNLSDSRIRTLPISLFTLAELQVLLLQNCVRLEKLPSDIGKLEHLEVLDLLGTELSNLPDQVGELARLRNLQLSFGSDDVNLPSQLISHGIMSKLLGLQAVSIIVHPENHRWAKIVGDMIREVIGLKMLSHLQFYFPEIENLQTFVGMRPSWRQNGLRTFKFVVGQDVKRIASRVSDEVDLSYDQQERCLRFVNGNELHPVIEEVLKHATAFYLDHHLQVSSLSEFNLSNFKELKFCVVRECPKVEVIIEKEVSLPSLEYLGIHYLWELTSICSVPAPIECFDVLKYLTVNMCPKLDFILSVSMLSCLPNLEELVVEDCEAVTKIVEGEVITVKNNVGILPRLRKLELRYLPELCRLGHGICLTEEQITVYGCPNLLPNVNQRKKWRSLGGCGGCFEASTAL